MSTPDCYLNGRLVSRAAAHVGVDDLGLLQGAGLFETMLAVDGRVHDAAAHLERMRHGLTRLALEIPESDEDLVAAIDAVAGVEAGRTRVRLTVTEGAGGNPTRLITATPYEPPSDSEYRAGVAVVTERDLRLDSRRPLRDIKSTSYLVHRLILRQAEQDGAYDALVYNERDRLVEAGRANVIVRTERGWITPGLGDGCLPGTVRRRLLEAGAVAEGEVDARAVAAARSVVLTNSLVGVLPIGRLDGRPLRVGSEVAGLRKLLGGPWGDR